MPYSRALAAYGSDKPDLRIPALLQPLAPTLLREIHSDVTVLRAGDGASADA